MGLFPKIESPCPYKDNLSAIMKGDFCSMCERNVFDLTDMSDADRQVFMSSCSGEVCVSYKIPVKKLVTSAMIATAASTLAVTGAAAQEAPEDLYCYSDMDWIIVGGVRDAGGAKWIDPAKELHLTDIPVSSEGEDDKDRALLLFALNGSDQDDKSQSPAKTAEPSKAISPATSYKDE